MYTYDGYPVLQYDGPDAGYRIDILRRIRELMHDSLEQHSQVLAVMLVVRFPESICVIPDNTCFQYFIEEYRRILNVHGFDPRYLWVAEQNNAQNHHYHLLLFLNGNKIRFFRLPPLEANNVWSRALNRIYGYNGPVNGLIHVGEIMKNQFSCHGYMIGRNNLDMQNEALQHFSYYAKIHSKMIFSNKFRVFSSSQTNRG